MAQRTGMGHTTTAVTLARGRRAYLVAFTILATGYLVLPPQRLGIMAAAGLVGATGIAFGIICQRPQRWGAWSLICAGVALSIFGVAYTVVVESPTGLAGHVPVHDVVGVEVFLPLTVGLLWLGRTGVPSRDSAVVLDTVVMSLASSLLVWIAVVRPVAVRLDLTGMAKVVAIASWVGYLAALAAAIRVALAWRANVALNLLAAGVLALLVADFLYAVTVLHGLRPSALVGAGYLAFTGLCGGAAFSTSIVRVKPVTDGNHMLGRLRLAMLAVALLVAPTALLVEATSGPIATNVAIAAVSAATGIVVLARLYLAVKAYRRRVSNERAASTALRRMFTATAGDEVMASLATALAEVVPAGAHSRVEILEKGRPADGPALALDGDQARLSIPVRSIYGTAGHTIYFTAPAATLVELSSGLRLLAEQADLALSRIHLTQQLLAEEREHYFRTLVLTSSDATIITREGRIEYATPSALPMFGRDIHGEAIDSVLAQAEDGAEAYLRRPDGSASMVLVRQRDLTADATVNGVVTTLRDVTAERQAQQALAHRAAHDPLTGLVNADSFRAELSQEAAASSAGQELSAALFVDLDDFKAVNDTYGHDIGDALLVTVAERIRDSLREQDVAARLGGDEFAALLRRIPDPQTAAVIARRLADSLALPAQVAGISLSCRSSIGVALARTGPEYESLLSRADAALYTVKAGGKGDWQVYREGMRNPLRRRADRRLAVQAAINDGALDLYYQPIIELASGTTAGFEALLRCRATVPGGIPSPQELVDVAAESGLTVHLGEWVLARALDDAKRLCSGVGGGYVSVNVSAPQLRHPGFVELVRRLLAVTGTPAGRLVLEVTENLPIGEGERVWEYLAHLRGDGVRIAIDDYGAGYASLGYLRQPDLDIVKIDRSFLRPLDARARILLDAVITTTTRLGLDQIAEGIDDPDAASLLLELGCRYGQGFHYAPAMGVDEAVAWVGRAQPPDTLR